MSNDLDELIHQKTRLTIMSSLYVVDELDMIYLKRKTGLTWGNISSHVTKLEQAEYLIVEKSIEHKKMKTVLKLTDKGRQAYKMYREQILDLLQ